MEVCLKVKGKGFWGDVWGSMDNNCSEVVKVTKNIYEGQVVINAASKLMFKENAFNHTKTRWSWSSLRASKQLKENLLFQMILCLVSGYQKTLTHSNIMARWNSSQVKTISPTRVIRRKSLDWLQSWVGYQHSWDILSLVKIS